MLLGIIDITLHHFLQLLACRHFFCLLQQPPEPLDTQLRHKKAGPLGPGPGCESGRFVPLTGLCGSFSGFMCKIILHNMFLKRLRRLGFEEAIVRGAQGSGAMAKVISGEPLDRPLIQCASGTYTATLCTESALTPRNWERTARLVLRMGALRSGLNIDKGHGQWNTCVLLENSEHYPHPAPKV